MQNIEIKTPLDSPDVMRERIHALGAKPVWIHHQRDVFFEVPKGYLKLRQVLAAHPAPGSSETASGPAVPGELIAYSREPGTEPRASDYHIVHLPEPRALEETLSRSLGVRGVVEKKRQLYLWKHTRIHIDEVVGLGWFLELETVIRGITRTEAEAETGDVIEALALDRSQFLDRPYLELLDTFSS